MDFEDFKLKMAADISEKMADRGENVKVFVKDVEMTNGDYTALSVQNHEGTVGMNINLEQKFDEL